MQELFSSQFFRTYAFEDVPLDQDLYLQDEKWMPQCEEEWIQKFKKGDYEGLGPISPATALDIAQLEIKLSWYPGFPGRYHEVKVSLPKSEFVICVEARDYDDKPHVFVKGAWLTNLHLRTYSMFAMVDAIGVKNALAKGVLTTDKLVKLRDRVDDIAKKHPTVLFISFADNLLLKSNWTVGQYDSPIKYTYAPEEFVRRLQEIQSAYRDILGMRIYAVLTQGRNEFDKNELWHTSSTGNHISLNSLGLPFAQLMAIDHAARNAIKNREHGPKELYMDEDFFYSLRFDHHKFDKNALPKHVYQAPMGIGDNFYFYEDCQTILDNLASPRT